MDQELLEILACPVCKTDITYDEANQKLVCNQCGRKYPIRDGISVMLEEEAERD
ncbi:MAG: Trm112 family protein [bacterium]